MWANPCIADHTAQLDTRDEHAPSISAEMNQIGPDEPFDVDEGELGDDISPPMFQRHDVRGEMHSTILVQYAPRTMSVLFAEYASMRDHVAVMMSGLRECDVATVGLHGVAEQQCQQRVHDEMTAIQHARDQHA